MRRIICATTAVELRAIRPCRPPLIDQLQVQRVHEIRWIDRMLGVVVAQLASRDLAQLVVDERQHAIERVALASAPSLQQIGDVRRADVLIRRSWQADGPHQRFEAGIVANDVVDWLHAKIDHVVGAFLVGALQPSNPSSMRPALNNALAIALGGAYVLGVRRSTRRCARRIRSGALPASSPARARRCSPDSPCDNRTTVSLSAIASSSRPADMYEPARRMCACK